MRSFLEPADGMLVQQLSVQCFKVLPLYVESQKLGSIEPEEPPKTANDMLLKSHTVINNQLKEN